MNAVLILRKDKILKHHGAVLTGSTWRCVCGFDLGLTEMLTLTQQHVVEAWAAHLADRLSTLR